jgi:hypothetical protein
MLPQSLPNTVRSVRSGQTNSIFQIDVVPTDGTKLPFDRSGDFGLSRL